MKYAISILLLISSLSVSAQTYESLDISFDDYILLANKGKKSPRVKVIKNILQGYDAYLTGEFRDQFKELFIHAEKNEYRMMDRQNIPFLISSISGCINYAISDLDKLDSRYLDSNYIKEYALVMSCYGLIDQMVFELGNMRSANFEYLKANEYESKTYSMWAKSFDTKRSILNENLRFLRHLVTKNEN
jgi:hypothetical protein